MKRFAYIFITVALLCMTGCNGYDDTRIKQDLDMTDSLLNVLEGRVNDMNTQLTTINTLIGSKFISFVSQDADGNYVISYRTGSGATQTLVLVTGNNIVQTPVIGIGKHTDGLYYWRSTADNGKNYQWLTDAAGNRMPVGGKVPTVGIDAEGYWTVDGVRLTDSKGAAVLAGDVSNQLFADVKKNPSNGMVDFTMTDGTVFSIPVFEALGIEFDAPVISPVPDRSRPLRIKYTLSGSQVENAVVDCFTAYNVTATVDMAIGTITVTLDEGAESGNVVIMAHADGNTILKPLFFTYGTAEIDTPVPELGSASGAVVLEGDLTSFNINVSANIEYEVSVSENASQWLIYNGTRAEKITTKHAFTADYYEDASGVVRSGVITFANRPYNVSTSIVVKQTPKAPISDVKGIATAADLVAFAAAVNAGASTTRWEDESGAVILAGNIDLSGVKEWTPIGQYSGKTSVGFKGIFDGKGYKLTGINWTMALKDSSLGYGLFGYVEGGTIRNLTLGAEGDKITYTGNSTSSTAMSALAGYVSGGTITSVVNNVSIELAGDDPSGTFTCMGALAAYATAGTTIGGGKADACENNGAVFTGKISNLDNGGAACMAVGGICGYVGESGNAATDNDLIAYVNNYGNVSAPTGRGGGIAGTLGYKVKIANCQNFGQIEDDIVGQFGGGTEKCNLKRMGGIIGGSTDTAGSIESCTNNGNVFSHIGCRTGGIAGHSNSHITGCANLGIILSDISYSSGVPQHGPGWLCGYGAKGIATYCTRGGKVGEYTACKDNPSSAPDATNDNAFSYKNADYFDPALNN